MRGQPSEMSGSTALPGANPSWITVSLTRSPSGSISKVTVERLSAITWAR
jgi:hypothetical protein